MSMRPDHEHIRTFLSHYSDDFSGSISESESNPALKSPLMQLNHV